MLEGAGYIKLKQRSFPEIGRGGCVNRWRVGRVRSVLA